MSTTFPIIAIGASAGGLEPLETFFENADVKSDFAYVIIQHLAPNHKSLMDELLSRHTDIPIHIIENNLEIEKGNIYLNPPKKFVEISEGKFVLTEKEDRKLSFPISSFFNSLAENVQENSCAIILSGTGSDGSEGIKFIKEKGGLVLVQNPEEAKFNGMPHNAINTGLADKICRVINMNQEIDTFFKNKTVLEKNQLNEVDSNLITQKILKCLNKHINVDFRGYKFTTINRRIYRRMSLLDFVKMETYYDYLKQNPLEGPLLSKELLIGVTRFFRDEDAFDSLKNKVIPELINAAKDSKSIRVWVPACSTGEEAYSIAILIKDHLRVNKLQYDVNIFATDLDKDAVKFASNRIFPESINTEIPQEYLNNYFIPQRSGYAVVKEIREMIVFSAHNLIQDAPFNKIDLISCRNFLIYLTESIQQQLFVLFQFSLRTNGFLFLGSSETLGSASENFLEFDKKHKIFVNKESKKFIKSQKLINRKNNGGNEAFPRPYEFTNAVVSNKSKLLNEIQHSLIQEYVPDTIVVDEKLNVLHTSGNVYRWLRLPVGEITSNVLKMLPNVIAMPIEVVAAKVIKSGSPVVLTDIKIPQEIKEYFNTYESLKIHIRRKEIVEGFQYLFITFEADVKLTKSHNAEEINVSTVSKDKINILERELRINRETLQTAIEELESSNEELQAANEELQSSNEELESVNEELYTVNSEFQEKNTELSESNDDLNNLIQSTDLALLFLDLNLNIRKYTPALKKLLKLHSHDIGRNISHFRGKIQLENFLEHIETVLEHLVPYEKNIEDVNGIEYLLKIAPFRTQKNKIDGIILVFVNLTHANKLMKALELSDQALSDLKYVHNNQDEIFKLISNNLRDMVCIINHTGNIVYCTPSGTDITGFSLERLYKLNLFSRIPNPKQKKQWQELTSKFDNNDSQGLIQFEFKNSRGEIRWFESNIKQIKQGDSDENKFLLTIRDVTERRIREVEYQKMSLLAEQTSSSIVITDFNGKITSVNKSFEKMTGYMLPEVLGLKPGDFLQGEESNQEVIKTMSDSFKKQKSFDVNIINYNKFGSKYFVNIKAEPFYDSENNFLGFFSLQNDITTQEDQINQIHVLNKKIKNQFKNLVEVNKSLEEFAYIASHDLKTPIRNISSLLELIRVKGDKLDDVKRAQYFDIIIKSSNDFNRLIDNLLEYSRTGVLKEELEIVNIPTIIDSTLQQV
jgi:two-component system CheB/CheR fusion protein